MHHCCPLTILYREDGGRTVAETLDAHRPANLHVVISQIIKHQAVRLLSVKTEGQEI